MSARQPGQRLSPVDEWFNRVFPSDSAKRLLFLVTASLLIGLLVEVGVGLVCRQLPSDFAEGPLHPGFSWIRYAALAGSSVGMLSLLWFSGSLHQMAEAAVQEAAAHEAARRRRAALPVRVRAYRPSWSDFATALPFGVACLLLVMWAVEQPFTPITLAASAAGGVLLSAMVVLRDTVWAPVLLSLVCGAGVGLFLMLLSTFGSGPQGFLANWAIGTAIAAAFFFSYWPAQRRSRAARLDIPIWVLMSGVLLLVAGAAVLIRFAE